MHGSISLYSCTVVPAHTRTGTTRGSMSPAHTRTGTTVWISSRASSHCTGTTVCTINAVASSHPTTTVCTDQCSSCGSHSYWNNRMPDQCSRAGSHPHWNNRMYDCSRPAHPYWNNRMHGSMQLCSHTRTGTTVRTDQCSRHYTRTEQCRCTDQCSRATTPVLEQPYVRINAASSHPYGTTVCTDQCSVPFPLQNNHEPSMQRQNVWNNCDARITVCQLTLCWNKRPINVQICIPLWKTCYENGCHRTRPSV